MSESSQPSINHEPPLGRFLVSFVLVPGTIVLVCLAIVVGIRWLAYSEASADQLVDTIERNEGNARWRAAMQLAGMLADPEHAATRQDDQLARRLTGVLEQELESGGSRREDVLLRVFLCRALGEFESDVSLAVLVEATSPERDGDVRRSAMEAIALLADSLEQEQVGREPGVERALLAATRDGAPQVRLTAAYALGVLGGEQAERRLVAMLVDEDALVRYNAATGLARQGNVSAIDVLVEMLASGPTGVSGDEASAAPSNSQMELVQVNALRALARLLDAHPEIAKDRIREAVARLNAATNSRVVRAEIGELQKRFDERDP